MNRTKFGRITGVIIAVFLATCLILLCACGNTTGDTTGNSSNNALDETMKNSPAKTSASTNKPSEPLKSSAEGTKAFHDIPRIPETTKPYLYFINTVDNEDILTDITTTPILWYEALESMSGSQLGLLRNEIYARHGYVFQSEALNVYFSQKSWYKPDPSIKEIHFSETEQANFDLIKNYENGNPYALIGGTIISWDLDGDGIKELIQFEAPSYDEYTLHVNHESITAVGDNLMGYCSIIDIDTSDSQCEILVRSMGPSNDDSFQLYRYKNDRIEAIGEVDGLLSEVPGNGYCSIRIRASVLQTWFLLDLYSLNEDGIMADMDQVVYPVSANIKMVNGNAVLEETSYIFTGQQKNAQDAFYPYEYNAITILKDLPVVIAPSDPQPAGVLKQGEKIVFLGSDNSQWVKIRGEGGITGWFKLNGFNKLVLNGNEYPADQFFSYLCYAD